MSKPVTFYAVNLDGTLKKRMGTISWKFGKAFRDQLHNQIDYEDAHLDIQFDNGMFVTENPDQIAYLDAYNAGGMITLSDKRTVKVPWEGQMFRITREDPLAKWVRVVKDTVQVEKKVIPESVLSLMDLDMKVAFCKEEGIELPKELTNWSIDEVLRESGRVA